VRPGIACYGLHPSAETPLPADFRPALSFHSEVAQVKVDVSGAQYADLERDFARAFARD